MKEKDKEKQTPQEAKKVINFQDYTKAIDEVYKDESSLSRQTKHISTSRRLYNITSKSDLSSSIRNSLDNPGDIAEISQTLFAVDPNYMKLISYFSDMFHIRYVTIPVQLDKSQTITSQEYLLKYAEMIEVVDGINLESLVPELLEEVFLNGAAYPYAEKVNASKTISVTLLPGKFCRTVLKTNFGTNLIEFDFKYFDQFTKKEDLERVLGLFPREFNSLYTEYKKDTQLNWKQLNPKFSTSIFKNNKGLAPLMNALDGIIEYEDVREAELNKAINQLKKILTHRIPIEEGRPIFDLKEVIGIQKAISKVTSNHEGLETITVFGDTELLSLQEDGQVENKRISQAYQTIYNSAGLNANLFSGDTDYSLKVSQSIDKAMVWRMIKQINAYINLAVNNLYKFKPLQTEIRILPITVYDEIEQVASYRENASFGLGKLDAIVATGVKQKHLTDQYRLEQELNLTELLTPLQSSHTASGAKTEEKSADEGAKEETETNPETENE